MSRGNESYALTEQDKEQIRAVVAEALAVAAVEPLPVATAAQEETAPMDPKEQAAALLRAAEDIAAQCRKMAEMLAPVEPAPIDGVDKMPVAQGDAATSGVEAAEMPPEPDVMATVTAPTDTTMAALPPEPEAKAGTPPPADPMEPDEDDKKTAEQRDLPIEPLSAMMAALTAQGKVLAALTERVLGAASAVTPLMEATAGTAVATQTAAPTATAAAATVPVVDEEAEALALVRDFVTAGSGQTLDLSTQAGVDAWLQRVIVGSRPADWEAALATLEQPSSPTPTRATAAQATTPRLAAGETVPGTAAEADEGAGGFSLSGLFTRRVPTRR